MTITASLHPVVADAARRISIPRREPADSFVLHAPLELAARVGIVERLDEADRPAALDRIAETAAAYEAAGDPVPTPAPGRWATAEEASADLAAALASGDLEEVDRAASWLGGELDAADARLALAATIAPSLAAAGHAPIGLHLLHRVAHGSLPTSLLRGPLREVARHPDWQLTWFPGAPGGDDDRTLQERLRAVPHLGRPGSDFIFPLMHQAESSGAAPTAIGPSLDDDLDAVRQTLLRAAVWSMLHDDPTQAPYGWTHALTLPQAVLSLAPDALDPATAIAVAGTHVVGFRAAHGLAELGPLGDADGDARPDAEGLAAALRAASVHPDAHLAKYVLACAHAGEDDPDWTGTYHRAAAHLVAWWRAADGG